MSSKDKSPEKQAGVQESTPVRTIKWIPILSWGITALLVACLVFLLLRFNPFKPKETSQPQVNAPITVEVTLPVMQSPLINYAVPRLADFDTKIPEGTRFFATKYTVEEGDTLISIAKKYHLKPETILWANFDLLNDFPSFLAPGWQLVIPPTDGIYYKWKEGDTLEKVAEKYYADVEDIISWPSNHMEITNPDTSSLEYVMVPGGFREVVTWFTAVSYAPKSGATRVLAGGCTSSDATVGSTAFLWPAGNHFLSGYDFSSYHLGIDIAAGTGAPVYASDSGTVVYAGWNDTGYGYMVMIDHNNGYQTLYAHLSSVDVMCGNPVYRGNIIGAAGSTGRSTGSHLHFEIRFDGQFVNPWHVVN